MIDAVEIYAQRYTVTEFLERVPAGDPRFTVLCMANQGDFFEHEDGHRERVLCRTFRITPSGTTLKLAVEIYPTPIAQRVPDDQLPALAQTEAAA